MNQDQIQRANALDIYHTAFRREWFNGNRVYARLLNLAFQSLGRVTFSCID